MEAEIINPFLESAQNVIEQVANVRPTPGKLAIKDIGHATDYIWIEIGLRGQVDRDIHFGLQEQVALKLISAMMGGYILTEMDEIAHSAISELGNMISGNASTMLFNNGITVDITPPRLIDIQHKGSRKAMSLPLHMDGIGSFYIQIIL